MVPISDIRLAVDDSKGSKIDTSHIFTQVTTRSGDYPPNETIESVGERLQNPNFLCMIDWQNLTMAGFLVAPVAQEVIVMWWHPRAWEDDGTHLAENNMPQLVPVFGEAAREVMRRFSAEKWPIYGDYPGAGETWSQRRRSSQGMVTEWRDYFNLAPGLHNPPDDPFAERLLNPQNPSQFRLKGTVGKVVRFADWVATQ